MKKSPYAVFFFALALTGCGAQTPDAAVDMGKALLERQTIATEWLRDLEQVADTTKNPEAHKLFGMLSERGVVAVPVETGFWLPDSVDDTDSIRVIALVPQDEKHARWKAPLEKNANALFYPEYHAIVLKDTFPMSPVFKGITLAHEAKHAADFLAHPRKDATVQEFCEGERDAHAFENRLFAGYEGYVKFISPEVARMARALKQTDSGVSFPPPGEYHSVLDTIFGPALSEYEKKTRELQIWIDTAFRVIDAYYAGPKEDMKTSFLCGVYKTNGLLPK